MFPLSYRSPKTEVRESQIHGCGLFATTDISKDEVVAVKGGYIVDRKTLGAKVTRLLGPVEIQIDKDLFIAPVTDEERELSMFIQTTHAIRISAYAARSRSSRCVTSTLAKNSRMIGR